MNTICNMATDVHRYHDDALPPDERRAMSEHLLACAQCARLLEELRSVSGLIRRSPLRVPADGALERLRGGWGRRSESSITRLAGWLTGAAAALLLVALLNTDSRRAAPQIRPGPWESVAVMSPDDAQDDAPSELLLAQWMADDLSFGIRR